MMKLFPHTHKIGTKKLIDKTKNGGNVPRLEVVEVVLIQCNLLEININESLSYYTLICPINIMLMCLMLNQTI